MITEALLAILSAALIVWIVGSTRRNLISCMDRCTELYGHVEDSIKSRSYDPSDQLVRNWLIEYYYRHQRTKGTEGASPSEEEIKSIFYELSSDHKGLEKEITGLVGFSMNVATFPGLLVILLSTFFFYEILLITQSIILPVSDYVYAINDGFLAFFSFLFAGPLCIVLIDPFLGKRLYRKHLGDRWEHYYRAANKMSPRLYAIFSIFFALTAAAGLILSIASATSFIALSEKGVYFGDYKTIGDPKLYAWSSVSDTYQVKNIYHGKSGMDSSTWYEIVLPGNDTLVISDNGKDLKYSAEKGAEYIYEKTGKLTKCARYNSSAQYERRACNLDEEMEF